MCILCKRAEIDSAMMLEEILLLLGAAFCGLILIAFWGLSPPAVVVARGVSYRHF